MKALTVFWDLVKGSDVEGIIVFRNSDYVRGLVAGVRCLLVRLQNLHTLSRDHDTKPYCRQAPIVLTGIHP